MKHARWIRAAAGMMVTVAAGFLFQPNPVFGASPEFARTPEEWSRLQDDVIEYEELAALIHEYNAAVQNNQYTYRKFREDYGDTNREVSDAYYELAQDFYQNISGESDAGSMMADLQIELQAENMMNQADNTLEDSHVYLLTYEQAECNLTAASQSDMILYHQKQLELEQNRLEAEIARGNSGMENIRYTAGTGTRFGVMNREEALSDAERIIEKQEAELANIRERLSVCLGWRHNDQPQINNLPKADMERPALINPEMDLGKALESNYTLKINERKLENAASQTLKETLESKIANNKKKIESSLSGAYKAVLASQVSCLQAEKEYELEVNHVQLASVKAAVGQITETEYKSQECTLKIKGIQREIAALALFQAMETYDWTVNGLAAAE